MVKLQRTTVPNHDGSAMLPAAECVCGHIVMIRRDGQSLYTHNCEPRVQCPMSRQRVEFAD